MARCLWQATYSTAIVTRFLSCGEAGMVLVSADGKKAKVQSINCKGRFCEPCMRDRSFWIRQRLVALMGAGEHQFVTFTLRGDDRPLEEVRGTLRTAMVAVRRSEFWKRTVAGGAWFTEITRGREGTHWHVHAHAVIVGRNVTWAELKAAWTLASGGSFVVDVEPIWDAQGGAEYVSRYTTKGIGRELSRYPDRLVEAIAALRGSRLIGTFGTWWGVELDEEPPEEHGWRVSTPLESLVKLAAAKEPWAVGLMLMLGRSAVLRGATLDYRRVRVNDGDGGRV
jgi:hypothetical protein